MSIVNSKIQLGVHNRSKVDMSNYHNITSDFGRLDCVYHTQLVPGDTLHASISSFLRAAPLAVPTFGSVRLSIRAFFVPYRIMYANQYQFNQFVTGTSQSVPSTIDPSLIFSALTEQLEEYQAQQLDAQRVLSQFGIPTDVSKLQYLPPISSHPIYAYYRIWYDYYRDSNVNPDNAYPLRTLDFGTELTQDVTDFITTFLPRYCCFNKDPYTSCMLKPQSGNPSVVRGYAVDSQRTAPSYGLSSGVTNTVQSTDFNTDPYDNTINTSLTVRSIRAAEALQRWLERNNISGSRAIQRFLLRYGNRTSGERLGMSQYLGGSTFELQVGDITTNNTPLNSAPSTPFEVDLNNGTYNGQLSGKAAVGGNSNNINFHADEFGEFMVISTIVPVTGYYQGLDPQLFIGTSSDRNEFFQPEFENIGLEPVKSNELFLSQDVSVFGFRPRYSTYKFKRNVVSGDLLTNAGYDSYHLYRDFISKPYLSDDFVYLTPSNIDMFDRIFVVGKGNKSRSYDHFLGMHHCNVSIERPMSNEVLPELETENHSSINVPVGGATM